MEKIRKVKSGSQGLTVPAIGLGCMGNVTWKLNGSKQYARKTLERSLKNLGTEFTKYEHEE